MSTSVAWPVHGSVQRPWRSQARGPKADRMTNSVTASVPPRIAAVPWTPDEGTAQLLAHAEHALRTLDRAHGHDLAALGSLLTRTESVASSRIEHERATIDDVARAAVGSTANGSAILIARAGSAVERLLLAAGSGRITELDLLDAHRTLMADDPLDGPYAGRYRDVQNWIGGGLGPRLATYVPPPPDLIAPLMGDLLAFVHRDDLHPIAQAALAHAQFESIHPFTDGNGRIGRALIAAVLRRRGLTSNVTAPIATVLAAERDRYFALLATYRDGAVDELVRDLAIAIGTVCDEATLTALLLDERRSEMCADPVAGTDPALLRVIATEPFVTEEMLERLVSTEHVDTILDALCGSGVLRPVTSRRRNRAWVVTGIATQIDAFVERVTDAVRARARDDELRLAAPAAAGE